MGILKNGFYFYLEYKQMFIYLSTTYMPNIKLFVVQIGPISNVATWITLKFTEVAIEKWDAKSNNILSNLQNQYFLC